MRKLKIVLDAGHGHYTAGKRCRKTGTREWDLNSRIASMVEEMLKQDGHEVVRVDDKTGKVDVALYQRVKVSNNFKPDFYLSIHHNAGLNGRPGGGTVVYYCSNKDERKRQAARLYKCITDETGMIGNRATPIAYASFYVIRKTTAPALLIENGFMDGSDEDIIITQAHAEKTAIGIYNFINSLL